MEPSILSSDEVTQQPQPALLAMMGPLLDDFLISTPTLATPVYGDLCPLEESQYFPFFNAGWDDHLLELGVS
jgi:hypothetical protein